MKIANKVLFILIILVQIVIIGYLYQIILLKNNGADNISINPIKKEVITFNGQHKFKHFYEPKVDYLEKETTDWLPYTALYTINKDSLNERFNYNVDKQKGIYRIITLGDSFTFGQFIDTKKNYPELLEDMLNSKLLCTNINKFEVINLGMKGYDIHYEVERFRLRGVKYKPDLVLWLISQGNFLQDNEYMFEELKQSELHKEFETEKFVIENPFYPEWEQARLNLINSEGETRLLEKASRSLQQFGQLYNGQTVIFGFTYDSKYKKVLFDFVNSKDDILYYPDIVNIYKLDGVLPDNHPNEKGYKMIAEDIFNYLTNNDIIPCN